MTIPSNERANRELFLKALQREPIRCGRPDCVGSVEIQDRSQLHDRIKTFGLACEQCEWKERITGREQLMPPWDETSLMDMAYEHLMHQPVFCPQDGTPVVFTSMPNPRRRARYRLSCYYCGRQAEMDWPPQEMRR